MGVCAACFTRDISGALGLHRASPVQYIRPEIIGFVLGSFLAAMIFREFRGRGGSAPIVRFVLGAFSMTGALVFLGCPFRAIFRIAGGDLNGIVGFAGFAVGIFVGTLFLKNGYSLGRSHKTYASAGFIMPLLMVGLLLLLFFFPDNGEGKSGILFYSIKGPGAAHAFLWISLGAGLLIGFLGQRSRICTMGGIRDLILFKQTHLFFGIIAMLLGALVLNFVFGQFNVGFEKQPGAHSMHTWNFLGMVLSGLAFCLAGGCPGRQLFMAGEGDTDAGMFVLGLLFGAAFDHNFNLASSPKGIGTYGVSAVIIGLVVCVLIGFTMREK